MRYKSYIIRLSISLFLLFTGSSFFIKAQFEDVIVGLGSGLNNHTSLIGAYAESMIQYKVAARISGGWGMWGPKFSIGPRYYFNYPRGDDFGISFSYIGGRTGVDKMMGTVTDGIQKIKYDLGSTCTLDIIVNHHWMYFKLFRFTAEAGYSIPFNTAAINSRPPANGIQYRLTDSESAWLRVERPGGLIIGASAAYIIDIKKK